MIRCGPPPSTVDSMVIWGGTVLGGCALSSYSSVPSRGKPWRRRKKLAWVLLLSGPAMCTSPPMPSSTIALGSTGRVVRLGCLGSGLRLNIGLI